MTLDAVADESWKKMADGVARSASRLRSSDVKDLLLWRRLEYVFLACLLAFVPCFLLFVFRVFFLSFFLCESRYTYLTSCLFVCEAAIFYSQ